LTLAVSILLFFPFCFSFQSEKSKQDKKVSTIENAKVFREATAWFKKGEALIGTEKENSDEQAALFLKAIQIQPDFIEAHYNLGLIYFHQEKMKEAIGHFEAVLKFDPKFDEGINFILASAYQEIGDFPSTIMALERGLLFKPNDVKMLRALAFLQSKSNRELRFPCLGLLPAVVYQVLRFHTCRI
jgi:tetratricopeptide (TPR) repeat protein